jgi:hypothetical protein
MRSYSTAKVTAVPKDVTQLNYEKSFQTKSIQLKPKKHAFPSGFAVSFRKRFHPKKAPE